MIIKETLSILFSNFISYCTFQVMRITESHPPINTKNIEMTVGFDALQNPTDNENLAEKLRLAQIQIGENETIKEQCLSQLREWISQNTDIEYIPTGEHMHKTKR